MNTMSMEVKAVWPSSITVPALDHDARMWDLYHVKVTPHGRGERRVAASLFAHLQANGFEVHSVYDGEQTTRVTTAKDAMELIFNLDEVSVRVKRVGYPGSAHGILLVLGNSPEELVSDWNYYEDDRDGFNLVMEAFDAAMYL